MQYTSRAIALVYFNHKESSIISTIFTELKGKQNFIVKGVKSKKSKKNLAFFQPLQLSRITVSYKRNRDFQILNNIELTDGLFFDSFNTNNFVCLFIAEVISKTLQENIVDKPLFEYLWNLKKNLTKKSAVDKNYILFFLLTLSGFFGFRPSVERIENPYFNLELGCFVKTQSKKTVDEKNSNYLKLLLTNKPTVIPNKNRKKLLNIILNYYKFQNHEIRNLTSHLIIESLRT